MCPEGGSFWGERGGVAGKSMGGITLGIGISLAEPPGLFL